MDSLYLIAKSLNDADSSDKMIDKLLKETRANKYEAGTINLLLLRIINLFNYGKYDDAIKVTYDIEKEVRADNNATKLARLFILRANCYTNLFFTQKSTECLSEAKIFTNQIKDNDTRYAMLGRIYRIMSYNVRNNITNPLNIDSVMFYRKKSYHTQLLIKNKKEFADNIILETSGIGDIFIEKGNIDSAKYYYQLSKNDALKYNQTKFLGESLLGIGLIYEKQNRLDSAKIYYNQALKASIKSKRISQTKKSHKSLSALYSKLGEEAEAKFHADRFGFITDSLDQVYRKASTITADYIIKEKENKHSKAIQQFIVAILGVVSFLFVLVVLIVKLNRNYKKNLLIKDEESKNLSKQIENLETDKLDEHILNDIIKLVKTNDPAFYTKFKAHHPIFIQKLAQYSTEILSSDIELMAKLKLGFNTKEIAYYGRTSLRAIESRKYRIRKKIGLTADDDLTTWVANL